MSPPPSHPVFSRIYPHLAKASERYGAAEHRRELLEGLSGRVIEVGAGHGPNFRYYPSTVTQVVAVECEPHMLDLAREEAARAPVAVELREGTAEALPAGDQEFDAAVVSLVLCTVASQQASLREIARVLRPGGELRFYEHVRSSRPVAAAIQRAADATVYPMLAGGCHSARDTAAAIRQAGFEVQREQRMAFKPGPLAPAIPHILGVARRA